MALFQKGASYPVGGARNTWGPKGQNWKAGGSRDLTTSLKVLADPQQGRGTLGVTRGHVDMEVAENSTCPSSQAWSHSSFFRASVGFGVGCPRAGLVPSELTSPCWLRVIIWLLLMEAAPSFPAGSLWNSVELCGLLGPGPSSLVTSLARGRSGMLSFGPSP